MLHLVLIIQVVFANQLSTIYELLHIWAVNHGLMVIKMAYLQSTDYGLDPRFSTAPKKIL